MQYERDQSSDSQASEEPSQRRTGQIAHDDLERGVVDTDKGPVIEEANRKIGRSSTSPRGKFNP